MVLVVLMVSMAPMPWLLSSPGVAGGPDAPVMPMPPHPAGTPGVIGLQLGSWAGTCPGDRCWDPALGCGRVQRDPVGSLGSGGIRGDPLRPGDQWNQEDPGVPEAPGGTGWDPGVPGGSGRIGRYAVGRVGSGGPGGSGRIRGSRRHPVRLVGIRG